MKAIASPRLDRIEAANRKSVEKLARKIEANAFCLATPTEDIEIFFQESSGKRMLDIGCGASRFVDDFILRGAEYTGIDMSPKMIDISRSRHPGLRFEEMSFRRLCFENESFDALWCCCVLHYEAKRNIPGVLREFRRVLVPGGLLLVLLPDLELSDEGFEGKAGSYLAHYFPEEFRTLLEAAGFTDIRIIRRYDSGSMTFLARS